MTTTLPAPEQVTVPVPYHRLAHTERHRWWRPLVGTLLVLAGAFAAALGPMIVAGIVGLSLGLPQDEYGWPVLGDELDLAVGLLGLGLVIPVVMLVARWTQRRPGGTVSSVAGRLRWGWLGRCVLLAVPAVGLMYAVLFLLPGTGAEAVFVGWERFLFGVAVVAVLVPFQAAGEEYLFRGWLVQAFGSWTRSPWPGIVVSSVLFGLVHGYGTPWGMADLIFFGVVAAVLTVRTGGLEAAIVLHAVGNLAALVTGAAIGALGSEETATDAPALVAAVDMAMVAVYGVAVLWLRPQSLLSR
ncbi:CPBP family intramembrane glutamic endopeptidase [Catenuloplanes atrovinosus]|uniref:Membrane protease YdiL (CAAX protease family) n=1 Tax=Catenuloplanes atrovinosus TaxID=137266 RepID=A0AAE3YLB1_9ACTN|nr:CPBP family intramembrane glutamic endopeptidase [Catenuloplanes atrovinosus]MDR7275933.1 membrane protease YdiL (CAAX protease family) [Catenuloplanes atrovinosus]